MTAPDHLQTPAALMAAMAAVPAFSKLTVYREHLGWFRG